MKTHEPRFIAPILGVVVVALLSGTGCVNENNRTPTKAESDVANEKRQSYIDTLPNLTPEQRAQMKAHMGGPPAPAPAGMPNGAGRPDTKPGA